MLQYSGVLIEQMKRRHSALRPEMECMKYKYSLLIPLLDVRFRAWNGRQGFVLLRWNLRRSHRQRYNGRYDDGKGRRVGEFNQIRDFGPLELLVYRIPHNKLSMIARGRWLKRWGMSYVFCIHHPRLNLPQSAPKRRGLHLPHVRPTAFSTPLLAKGRHYSRDQAIGRGFPLLSVHFA